MKRWNKLDFNFLRDTVETTENRQLVKAETFYAGSILVTNSSTFNLLAEALVHRGDNILNEIIKMEVIRSKANNLMNKYRKTVDNPDTYLLKMVDEMLECLTRDAVKYIKKYQHICIVYNELKCHKESFDADENEEDDLIYNKISEILFNRFLEDDWIAPENESYNKPKKKLNVEYNYDNIKEYWESYISEFMEELNVYISKDLDKDIIKEKDVIENDDIFWELYIDYRYAEAYRQMKKALIDIDEAKRICNDKLTVDNVGELLKEQRNFLKMTMRDVSTITGLTTGYISRIENGSSTPSLDTLTKLCTAYNIPNVDSFIKSNNVSLDNEMTVAKLDDILAKERVSIEDTVIDSTDKIAILNFAKLLSNASSTESKEALKNIVNNLITLEKNN